jgi:hypothetical protein
MCGDARTDWTGRYGAAEENFMKASRQQIRTVGVRPSAIEFLSFELVACAGDAAYILDGNPVTPHRLRRVQLTTTYAHSVGGIQ